MSDKASIEVVRRVFDDQHGVCIEVGPWPDAPDVAIGIWTSGAKNIEWFGSLNVSMSPEYAECLGRALIDAAGDFRAMREKA